MAPDPGPAITAAWRGRALQLLQLPIPAGPQSQEQPAAHRGTLPNGAGARTSFSGNKFLPASWWEHIACKYAAVVRYAVVRHQHVLCICRLWLMHAWSSSCMAAAIGRVKMTPGSFQASSGPLVEQVRSTGGCLPMITAPLSNAWPPEHVADTTADGKCQHLADGCLPKHDQRIQSITAGAVVLINSAYMLWADHVCAGSSSQDNPESSGNRSQRRSDDGRKQLTGRGTGGGSERQGLRGLFFNILRSRYGRRSGSKCCCCYNTC